MSDPPRYRIYYGDGSTHEGDPYLAPGHNCQVIGIYGGPEPKLVRGKDFYVWLHDQETWIGVDLTGLTTWYFNKAGPQKTLCGATMPDSDEYWDLCKRALREGPEK